MAHTVIIGGGLAGVRTAESLRTEGWTGDITLLAAEDRLPYDRPPLSKGYLKGEVGLDKVVLHEQQWYDDQAITVRTGVRAHAVDPEARTVSTSAGDEV